MHRFTTTTLALLALASGAAVIAGPLTPPAGPVAPTFKTLAEVEPRIAINAMNTPGDSACVFKISQPGSYYFTGNVTGTASKTGIMITSPNVTIDLMGHTLQGVPGSWDGIANFGGPYHNVTVRNGVVTGWGGSGLDLSRNTAGHGSIIENIRAEDNGNFGIRNDYQGVVRACTSMSNGGTGLVVINGGVAESCTSAGNGGSGIYLAPGAIAHGCVARYNTSHGFEASWAVITGCGSILNDGHGFSIEYGSRIESCTVIQAGLDGIRATTGSSITGCNVYACAGDGIEVGSDCVVLNNLSTTSGNGIVEDGAGIHALGSDNRIEGNTATGADRGVDVDAGGNIIVRNACSGNTTNWTIAAGNALAPIIQAATNAAAVSGNTYAGGLGSLDSNANVTY